MGNNFVFSKTDYVLLTRDSFFCWGWGEGVRVEDKCLVRHIYDFCGTFMAHHVSWSWAWLSVRFFFTKYSLMSLKGYFIHDCPKPSIKRNHRGLWQIRTRNQCSWHGFAFVHYWLYELCFILIGLERSAWFFWKHTQSRLNNSRWFISNERFSKLLLLVIPRLTLPRSHRWFRVC